MVGGGHSQHYGSRSFGHWFIVADPEEWSFSEIKPGERQSFTLVGKRGGQRLIHQNFLDARRGDYLIGYESTPVKEAVALCRVVREARESYGKDIVIEKVRNLGRPVGYGTLRSMKDLRDMEFFSKTYLGGTLFGLTNREFEAILRISGTSLGSEPARMPASASQGVRPVPAKKEESRRQPSKQSAGVPFLSEERQRELVALTQRRKNVVLFGPSRCGKTFVAEWLARELVGADHPDHVARVQFHAGTTYDDLVWGIRLDASGDYRPAPGVLMELCDRARKDIDRRWVLVIEDVDAADASRTFGETWSLIDPARRGVPLTLTASGRPFSVPRNVRIIATATSADFPSVELLRCFAAFELGPAFEDERFVALMATKGERMRLLAKAVREINEDIARDARLGPGRRIGHGYLLGCEGTDEDAASIARYDLAPLVQSIWPDDATTQRRQLERLRQAVG